MSAADPGLVTGADGKTRCWWGASDPDYVSYHDDDWGRPLGDDRGLFELMCLEGFQAGLSWLTILRKRESFGSAFRGFDIEAVARFNKRSIERLMVDPGSYGTGPRSRPSSTTRALRAVVGRVRKPQRLRVALRACAGIETASDRSGRVALDGLYERVRRHEQGPQEEGMGLRRPHHHLFVHAVGGLVNDHLDGCDWRTIVEEDRRRFVRPSAISS